MPGLSNNNNNHTLHRSNNTSVTNAPPPAMTNPYVQSRSIQTTLTSLTNETQTLREETRRLDSQRLALQERMKQHVQLQQRLDHEIRGAQDQLGAYHRQRTMLVQEQSRLETQLGQERRAMQTCATEYEGLLKREKERKIQFCKDITEANKEMGDLLKQQDEESLLRKITPASQEFIKQAFDAAMKNVAATGGATLAADMEMALDAFASAARNMDHAVAEKEQLQHEIEILRDLALQGAGGAAGKNLSMDMLVNLEGVWQEDWQPEDEEEEDEENDPASGDGMNEQQQQQVLPPLAAGATCLGSPLHMQLFYNQVIGRSQQQQQHREEEHATEDGTADSSMPPPPPLFKQQQQQHGMAMTALHEQQQY